MSAFRLILRLRGVGLALTVLFCLPGPGGPADARQDGATALHLQVFVNDRDSGFVIAVTRTQRSLFTARSELAAVGIETRDIATREVDLSRVDGLSWRYDASRQVLHLAARPARLAPRRISPRKSDRLIEDHATGAALNYDVNVHAVQGADGRRRVDSATLGIDAWAFWRTARIATTGLATIPIEAPGQATWRRYDTRLQIDLPRHAATLTFGDAITSSLGWGRALRIGGVRIGRDFALRCDLVTQPLPAFEGSVAVPTSVDVFIEGNRVYSDRVAEGRFLLDDIPVISGAGTAIVSLRGADGTVTRTSLPFYGARGLLAPGVTDCSVEAGYPRLNFGTGDDRYTPDAVLNATLRRGMTDALTLELQAAAARDFRHAALGVRAVMWRAAEASLTFGISDLGGRRGRFHHAELSTRIAGRLRLEASHFRASPGYADLVVAVDRRTGVAALGPERARDVISLNMPTGIGGLGLGLSHIRVARDDKTSELTSLGLSRTLPRWGALLSLSGTHDWQQDNTRIAALVTFRRGKHAVQAKRSNRDGTGLSVSRTGDGGIGSWGYNLQADGLGNDTRVSGRAWAQRRHARVELSARRANGRTSGALRLQGAFALMDRRVTAGPRITGSFAVVDLGRPGLPVRLQNREVARTGGNGRALVTGLQAYSRNRISVDIDALPADATWTSTASDVVPARAAGSHVSMGVADRTTTRLIRIEDGQGRPLRAGTPARIDGVPHDLGIGYDGLLLLSDPRPGARLDAAGCSAAIPPPRPDGAPAVVRC